MNVARILPCRSRIDTDEMVLRQLNEIEMLGPIGLDQFVGFGLFQRDGVKAFL